jgi:hypothetical protein
MGSTGCMGLSLLFSYSYRALAVLPARSIETSLETDRFWSACAAWDLFCRPVLANFRLLRCRAHDTQLLFDHQHFPYDACYRSCPCFLRRYELSACTATGELVHRTNPCARERVQINETDRATRPPLVRNILSCSEHRPLRGVPELSGRLRTATVVSLQHSRMVFRIPRMARGSLLGNNSSAPAADGQRKAEARRDRRSRHKNTVVVFLVV